MALQINKKRTLFFEKVNLGELLTLNNETIWKKERPPTPVFWPEEFHGPYSPWDCKELDMTERLSLHNLIVLNSAGKESACNAGDLGSIPGLGRSPGGGHDNPFHCFCLENLMDRGAWWATVHRVAKSRTRLSNFHFH